MPFYILIVIFITSCTNSKSIKRRDLDHLYIGGSEQKYFLPDIPSWSNFSNIAKCKVSTPIKYLNFENLYRSYGLNYTHLVQFQYLFNQKLEEYKKESKQENIILQDEAYLFFNVQEQILGGAKAFLKPDYNKINIFWIDPAIKNQEVKKQLLKKLNSPEGLDGHPIFLSRCLDGKKIDDFVKENNLANLGIRYMPSFMFSPYNKFMKLGYEFEVNLGEILKGKDVTFYGPSYPSFISGDIKIKTY